MKLKKTSLSLACLILTACQAEPIEEITNTASGAINNVNTEIQETVSTFKAFKADLDMRIDKAQRGLSLMKEGSKLLGEAASF